MGHREDKIKVTEGKDLLGGVGERERERKKTKKEKKMTLMTRQSHSSLCSDSCEPDGGAGVREVRAEDK